MLFDDDDLSFYFFLGGGQVPNQVFMTGNVCGVAWRVVNAAGPCGSGVSDGGRTHKLLHRVEHLPLERAVTWRYHLPATVAVGPPVEGEPGIDNDPECGARSANYTVWRCELDPGLKAPSGFKVST